MSIMQHDFGTYVFHFVPDPRLPLKFQARLTRSERVSYQTNITSKRLDNDYLRTA